MAVTLPPNLRAIEKYPGYFWDIVDHKLYSIKGGQLKPMKLITWKGRQNINLWGMLPYYCISHKGRRRYLAADRLKARTYSDPYELPVVPR